MAKIIPFRHPSDVICVLSEANAKNPNADKQLMALRINGAVRQAEVREQERWAACIDRSITNRIKPLKFDE